jgi:hypothetical protein
MAPRGSLALAKALGIDIPTTLLGGADGVVGDIR